LKKRATKRAKPEHTNIFILGENNHFTNAGHCVLPNSGHAWPVPRIIDDVETILAAYRSPFRLEHYGYVPRIGALVWNRDKRQKFYTEKDAATKAKAPFPLIWSRDVRQTAQHASNDRRINDRYTFVDMKRLDHSSVVRRPSVVLQRVTSSDQPRRLVAAPVDMALLKRFGGVVGENHVVFLEQISAKPALSPTQLSKVLRSAPIDRLFRCISGATNVSVFELSQLPMPDPVVLQEQLKNAINIDTAVMRAFRLDSHPISHTIQRDNLEKI
jgi:adenine-specific DNA-methyltransferase